jgi:predicted GNAT family acetyltransferase
MEPSVANAPQRRRFEITVGGASAGFTEYVEHGDQRIFHHTEIDERFAGLGLGGVLANGALTATRADQLRIVAVCPFIAKYLTKHDEFDDIVDPVTPEALRAVEQE